MSEEKKLSAAQLKIHLNDCFSSGVSFPLKITGHSMSPFLCENRDSVLLAPPEKLRRGDIILYERTGAALILHRIVKIKNGALYTAGDNQSFIEGPVEKNSVIAVAVCAVRRSKRISKKSFLWRFFASFWIILLPFRRSILKFYSFLKAGGIK